MPLKTVEKYKKFNVPEKFSIGDKLPSKTLKKVYPKIRMGNRSTPIWGYLEYNEGKLWCWKKVLKLKKWNKKFGVRENCCRKNSSKNVLLAQPAKCCCFSRHASSALLLAQKVAVRLEGQVANVCCSCCPMGYFMLL